MPAPCPGPRAALPIALTTLPQRAGRRVSLAALIGHLGGWRAVNVQIARSVLIALVALYGRPVLAELVGLMQYLPEVLAVADRKLGVDVAQVGADGLGCHEQTLGDLPVGQAVGGKPGDA
jgi:hypothetical protein